MKDDIKKNDLVVQANALVSAGYRLTLQEKRLILSLISRISRDDEDFKTYRFKVKELAEMFEIDVKNFYDRVAVMVNQLRKKDLIIKFSDRTLYTGWLSSADYFYKGGYVELCFDPKLKPFLLKVKEQFTAYALKNVVKFRRVYSIRIYELLRQYLNTDQKTRIIEIEDLRIKLGIVEYDRKGNILKEKFKLYGDIKKNILKPVQKELKEKSDIYFEFEEKKTGRKVTAVKFYIIEQEKKELPKEEEYDFNKVKVEFAVSDIIKATGDEKSKDYFYKVAWAFILGDRESALHQAVSELKADGRNVKNKGAFFTKIVKRIAKEAGIKFDKR